MVAWVKALRALVAACVLAGVVVAIASPAAACTCGPRELEDLLVQTDVGFVGTVVGAERFSRDYEFSVEEWIHGDRSSETVVVAGDPHRSSGCGLDVPVGGRVAVFADDVAGRLEGGVCATLIADVVLAQLHPLEAQDGRAELAVVGEFAEGSVAHVARDGSFLGYVGETVEGHGMHQAASCPAGDVVAMVSDRNEWGAIALEGGRIGFEPLPVDDVALIESPLHGPLDISCVDGGPVVLLRSAEGFDVVSPGATDGRRSAAGPPDEIRDAWLVGDRIVASGDTTIWSETTDRGWAGFSIGPDAVWTGVAVSPDGERFVALSTAWGDARSRLHITDVELGRPTHVAELDGVGHTAAWLDDRRVAVLGTGEDESWVHVVDADDGTLIGTTARAVDIEHAVWFEDALWSIFQGSLLRVELGGEPERMLSFPTTRIFGLHVLETPFERVSSPATTVPPVATTSEVRELSGRGQVGPDDLLGVRRHQVKPVEDRGILLWWLGGLTLAFAAALAALALNRRSPSSRRGGTGAVV